MCVQKSNVDKMNNINKLTFLSILWVAIFITSCNGQVKTNLLIENATSSTGQPKLIKTEGSGKFDKQYDILGCGLQDKAGNLWFGTSREGVYRYDGKLFTHFTVKDGLCSNAIISILEDKTGNIWFFSQKELCRFDGKTFTSIPIPAAVGVNFLSNASPNSNPLEENKLWSVMLDKSGKFWLGTTDGVYCYNGKVFTPFLDNSILNKNRVHLKWTQCMLEDKSGNIWFGSWVKGDEGICRYDGKSISQYKPYGGGWIRHIIEDKNGDILCVTRLHGVCRFDGKTFTNFTEKGGIDNSSIDAILEDKAGNLWFGTEKGSGQLGEDGGLWRFDGKSFTTFTTKDGLVHNGVFFILEDRTGNIWIGTRNTGLSRYDGKTFTSFSE